MKDPDIPSIPNPSPAQPGDRPSERRRLFTPIDSAPSLRARPPGRLAPVGAFKRVALTHDDPAAQQVSGVSRDPAPPERPALVPNSAITFLENVHASSEPVTLERRFANAKKLLAYSGLGVAVLLAVASTIALRAPKAGPLPAAIRVTPFRAPAAVALSPEDAAAAIRQGVAALQSFQRATSPAERRTLVDPHNPLPASLLLEGRLPGLAGTQILSEQARLLQAGTLNVVLVPVTDPAGVSRTAAILQRAGGWQVDWRSLVTPETAPWQDVVSGHAAGSHLFRVHVSRDANGQWSLSRASESSAARTPAILPRGSRTAGEFEAVLAARDGKPFSADVYVSANPDRSLNIVDWTRDKWSM